LLNCKLFFDKISKMKLKKIVEPIAFILFGWSIVLFAPSSKTPNHLKPTPNETSNVSVIKKGALNEVSDFMMSIY